MNRPRDLFDWCAGCETPLAKRVNLPATWKAGDVVPENVTMHSTPSERINGREPFAFRGNPVLQDRVEL